MAAVTPLTGRKAEAFVRRAVRLYGLAVLTRAGAEAYAKKLKDPTGQIQAILTLGSTNGILARKIAELKPDILKKWLETDIPVDSEENLGLQDLRQLIISLGNRLPIDDELVASEKEINGENDLPDLRKSLNTLLAHILSQGNDEEGTLASLFENPL